MTKIILKTAIDKKSCLLLLAEPKSKLQTATLSEAENQYVNKKRTEGEKFVVINRFNTLLCIQFTDDLNKKNSHQRAENLRVLGHKVGGVINQHKYSSFQIVSEKNTAVDLLNIAEGAALGNYQFLKYRSDKSDKNTLTDIVICSNKVNKVAVDQLNVLKEAVYKARNLVNEPQSFLNAVSFSEEMKSMGKSSGLKVEVLNKKQIQSLGMGGLLAVNAGSQTPPTFTIMEWKPKAAKNKKPLVLVGKGVVYDTGGLSLKPTANSMDTMKCDMAGGALVASTMYAIAKAKLPVHVVGLVPATDNRPGENAYTPGDVITMYDGQTVEVLNTDAEGRMLLADALSYAAKYDPYLVIDFATLTGAAAAAIGPYGIVCMGTADEKYKSALKESGNKVYERLVEFPMWDEYGKLIKSDLADMKNIGGPIAGAITAGKFLEKFVKQPWMHFDIAGPAFINSPDSYRGKHGTGYGVRLMFDYISKLGGKK